MNIGFYGGTFDPPHRGHIKVANEILERGLCDRIYLMPNYNNFDKNPSHFYYRFKMCQLAVEQYADIEVHPLESKMGIKYPETYDVVKKFINPVYGNSGTTPYFICGEDIACSVLNWRDGDKLTSEINFIVIAKSVVNPLNWYHRSPHKVISIKTIPVNSTYLREKIKKRRYCEVLPYIPLSVLDYIFQEGLYV